MSPLGLFGGFIDASGGGDWGPDHHQHAAVPRQDRATHSDRGSVSALEFLVAASASLGFVVGLGEDFINNLPVVMGLAAGGNLVAPVAAWLVSQISPVMVGNVVGGLIVLTNSQKLVTHFGVEWPWSTFVARGPRVAGVSRARVRTRGAGEPDPVAEPEKSTR